MAGVGAPQKDRLRPQAFPCSRCLHSRCYEWLLKRRYFSVVLYHNRAGLTLFHRAQISKITGGRRATRKTIREGTGSEVLDAFVQI